MLRGQAMTINLKAPELRELKPRIMVCGVGGAGGNAVNNMIASGLVGVDFIVANTDAQALTASRADRIIQMGLQVTEGLGAGSHPEVGRAAAEEAIEEIRDHLAGAHMCFVTAGMGGGTGTGAAPVIARAARDMGILTVGVVTKPFQFEGMRRMRTAEMGIEELQKSVDTLIVIPNQNLFRVANEKTTFADAFAMADQVLYSGVACITDLMVKEGLINLDFADVRSIMREMGKAMMGTGEATGDRRAILAAEAAIANPLLDEVSMRGAKGLLISITGGNDLTLYEVDEAASRIRQEVDEDANIILGATFDQTLDGIVRVSVVATGIDQATIVRDTQIDQRMAEAAQRLRAQITPAPLARSIQVLNEPEVAPAPVAVAPAPAPAPVAPSSVAPAPLAMPSQMAPAAPAYDYAAPRAPVDYAPQRAAVPMAPAPQPVHYAPQAAVPPMPMAPAQQTMFSDVHIEPRAPRASLFAEQPAEVAPRAVDYREPAPFIPPAPEMPLRAPRMPTIDDLPLPGQQQLRAQQDPQGFAAVAPEAKRRTLLDRLASFGMSRESEQLRQPAQSQAPQPAQRPAMAPPPEFAKRPPAPMRPQSGYDAQPRMAARVPSEDEQLEIPAFLRRQSS